MKSEDQEKEIERLKKRLSEYSCAWNRQQGIINSLSDALIAQEQITLRSIHEEILKIKGNKNETT